MNSISVIMINKNRGFCLHRSISSVISQLAPCDELLLIDDSSDDNSSEIMENFADHAVIDECSSGGNRSLVRNLAASRSKGDILLFLDSDVALFPGSLEIIRNAFDDPEVVGASGSTFGNDHDRDQFEILSHIPIDKFAEMYENNPAILYDYPRFFDYRWHNPDVTSDTTQNWKCFFGCFNAARRDAYIEIGGFDEGFTKWGSEDIEFGYRLNKKGKIVYCRDAIVFHHCHGRDYFGNARSNMENLYYFLRKHMSFDMEVFCTFKLDANPTRMDSLDRMCSTLASHNVGTHPHLNENEAAICFPSQEHPHGCIKYRENGEIKHFELFGFAIPVTNKRFERIYITSAYHALPDFLLSMVFQEALRAGKEVFAEKNRIDCPAVYYDEPGFFNGTPVFKDSIYICQVYDCFTVSDFDENYYRVAPNEEISISITGR